MLPAAQNKTPLRPGNGTGAFRFSNCELELSASCGCGGSCGGGGFFRGLGCGRGLAAPLGLGRCGRGFADELGRHDAGDEELRGVIVEIDRGAFLIGSGDDSESINIMLDGLTFLH